MKTCILCEEPGEVYWQPLGPDDNPLTFVRPGSHYRGFPIIPVCGFCQREKIEAGDAVRFTYRKRAYNFKLGDSAPIEVRLTPTEQILVDALREALDLFAHEFCYADGRVINVPGNRGAGGDWVEQARAAITQVERGLA